MTDQKREPAAPAGEETKKVKPELKMPKNPPRGLILPDDRARVTDPESTRPNTSRVFGSSLDGYLAVDGLIDEVAYLATKAEMAAISNGVGQPTGLTKVILPPAFRPPAPAVDTALLASVPSHARDRIRAEATKRADRPALPVVMTKTVGGQNIQAFTSASVMKRWEEDAAGIRSLERDDNVITMFEMIGEDYWSGGGVTAKKVASQLKGIGGRPVEVQINSPGGSMFEGLAIYNVLREHPYPVTVKVMGMAASAASIIAMAGDEILIGAASFLMIHNCWVMAAGNRHDFEEMSRWLEPFDEAMATVYTWRANGKTDQKAIAKMMDEETYLSGSQAIAAGLADDLLSSDKLTVDSDAKAKDKEFNRLRAMEISLMSRGLSRSEAQKEIKALRGTTDSAARNDGTADPADNTDPPVATHEDWMAAGQQFLAELKGAA